MLHNFDTFRGILIIFGRDEEEDQKACHMQEKLLPLSSDLSHVNEAITLYRS